MEEEEENQMSIPLLFRCPISLDLFTDPVTLPTGQTYDRPSIEEWLAGGNLTCPVTMQRLPDLSFVPNTTLRHYIQRWLLRGVSDRQNSPQNSTFLISLKTLKTSLLSPQIPLPAKLEALKKIKLLSTESDVGKFLLIQLDFFPVLVRLVFQIPLKTASFELLELALDCILCLCPSNLGQLNFLNQDSAFSSLVVLMDSGSLKMKSLLCILIETIAKSTTTKELCSRFGKSRPLLRSLISLLSVSDAAAGAIAGICATAVCDHLIEEGAVEGLAEYLSSGVGRNCGAALAAMEVLMGEEIGRQRGGKIGVVGVMVKWVFRVSGKEEGSKRAVGALTAICGGSMAARKEAVAAGVVTQLLLLLQSQCGGGTKATARALLKFLRSSWEQEEEEEDHDGN